MAPNPHIDSGGLSAKINQLDQRKVKTVIKSWRQIVFVSGDQSSLKPTHRGSYRPSLPTEVTVRQLQIKQEHARPASFPRVSLVSPPNEPLISSLEPRLEEGPKSADRSS